MKNYGNIFLLFFSPDDLNIFVFVGFESCSLHEKPFHVFHLCLISLSMFICTFSMPLSAVVFGLFSEGKQKSAPRCQRQPGQNKGKIGAVPSVCSEKSFQFPRELSTVKTLQKILDKKNAHQQNNCATLRERKYFDVNFYFAPGLK